MSSPIGLSQESVHALRHLKDRREVNTVILRSTEVQPRALVPAAEANLTHDELIAALPADEARLVVHELSFATREGTRRNEPLLILWVPSDAGAEEGSYTAAYAALKEFLADVHVHLTARRREHLEYGRLVALAG
ncbi:cofilin family protein [Streptomyces sp. NPDC006512]|uniref:cofilin family protein n=1 Tax=Streptomyces sp. NPDC006512 TaxID=3154307 RepID=UPI00339F3FD5